MKDKKALLIYLAAFVLMIVAVQCYRPSTDAGPVGVGQEAPRFMLRDISGREVSLDQYKGKIVILDFWQTTCPPCRESMPMLDKIQEDYAGKLSILAINLGEPKNLVRDFILRQNLTSRVLLDEDWSVGTQYGAVAIPTQVLIDQEGVIRYGWTGYRWTMDAEIRAEINKLL